MTDLLVPSRFCGPPASGNGGWTAGALAGQLGLEAVRVSLRMPPPLDTVMPVTVDGTVAAAPHEGAVVAQAEPGTRPRPVPAVPAEVARSTTFPDDVPHPFPTCFVCGPARAVGDGLRILPGPLEDGRWATVWTPAEDHATVPVAWAAVDCVGGWAGGFGGRTMVLAGMTATVDLLPGPGTEHLVVGELRRREGRKAWTAASLYSPEGVLAATAEHLWIEVDPARLARN